MHRANKGSERRGKGRGSQGKRNASTRCSENKVSPTAKDYYEKGVAALSTMEPELAISFLKRALSMDPDNVSYMDVYSEACIQLGESDEALTALTKATNISDDSYYRWLTLAQLQEGMESLSSFKKGIALMVCKLEDRNALNENETKKLRSQMSQAYAGIADLYMTDLCFEENAEMLCEECIQSAIKYDPMGLDAHQSMANLRLSQKKNSEAHLIIGEVYSRTMELRKKHQERGIIRELMRSSNEVDESSSDKVDRDDEEFEVPSTQFSVQTAKLLIECSNNENDDFCSRAICLLTDLLHDDDENIEIWYIIGIAALEQKPPDYDLARYNLERAQEMMKVVHQQMGADQFPFIEEMHLVEEHLKFIRENEEQGKEKMSITTTKFVSSDIDDEDEEWSTEEEAEVESM